jgi:hypothetical protein
MDAVEIIAFPGLQLGSSATDQDASALAAELHSRALREDATLTQDVFGAADQIGACHRERRIKSMPSLAAKILRRPELGIYGAAASIDDALAYYMVIDPSVFESRYRAILMALERQGHRVVRESMYATATNRYKGSQVSLMSRNGMPFEIQFHTPASLDAKRLSDALTAMYRDPQETSPRRFWAEEQHLTLMGQLAPPADLHLLGVPQTKPGRM